MLVNTIPRLSIQPASNLTPCGLSLLKASLMDNDSQVLSQHVAEGVEHICMTPQGKDP